MIKKINSFNTLYFIWDTSEHKQLVNYLKFLNINPWEGYKLNFFDYDWYLGDRIIITEEWDEDKLFYIELYNNTFYSTGMQDNRTTSKD